MIVAGVDASLSRTGIAITTHGQPTALHSIGWGTGDAKDDLDRNRRVRALARDVSTYIRQFTPNVLAIEKPLTFKPTGYAYDRFFLCQMIVAQFDIWGIPTVQIHNKKRPPWVLGVDCPPDSKTTKKLILTETRTWYPGIRILNDDIADALAVNLMTAHHYGQPMPFELKDRHTLGLEGIPWPALDASEGATR
jgi:Holliday junction resolvasome RuvABC endonuclease subunit